MIDEMAKLKLNDIKIQLPEDFEGSPTEAEFVEWLKFELGIVPVLKVSNTLFHIELRDCNISIGSAMLNNKPFVI